MHRYGVFASRWPLQDQTVWTIVNRNEFDVDERQISIAHRDGQRYFDLYHGKELTPEREGADDVLSFHLEAKGTALFWPRRRARRRPARTYVAHADADRTAAGQLFASVEDSTPATGCYRGHSALRHRARRYGQNSRGEFLFKMEGIEIEGGNDIGVDVQYPWENMPRRFHEHKLQIKPSISISTRLPIRRSKQFLDATTTIPRMT